MVKLIYEYQNDENISVYLEDKAVVFVYDNGTTLTEINISDAVHIARLILKTYE